MAIGILFDLDGTLLDTLQDLYAAVNVTMVQFGYPERTLEEVRCFVGNGARRLIALSVPSGADVDTPFAFFSEYYRNHCRIATAPYPGIPEALAAIARHHRVAIVSNKPDAAVKILCADYFPGIFAMGESSVCPRKPAPDMLYRAMSELNCDSCIYVGDSEVDVQTARNASVPCLSVLWGFRNRQTIAAAGGDTFCARPEDMPDTIEMMINKMRNENGQ